MKGVVKIGLFRRKKKQEIRADTGQSGENTILTFFGLTGELTREAALSIPTVSACINKVGETISDIDEIRENRRDKTNRFIGENVIDICACADITAGT